MILHKRQIVRKAMIGDTILLSLWNFIVTSAPVLDSCKDPTTYPTTYRFHGAVDIVRPLREARQIFGSEFESFTGDTFDHR